MAAIYTIQNLIDRARIYVDDNQKVTKGWKQPEDWLTIAKPEIINCYRKWIREGLIALEWVDTQFTGPIFQFPDKLPMVILGVAQLTSNGWRRLLPGQILFGRAPFEDAPGNIVGPATHWGASLGFVPVESDIPDVGLPGIYQVRLHPPDTAANYYVRYIPEPIMTLTSIVYVPEGFEDYICLLIARKALASEGASSQAIERLIMKAESDMKLASLSNPEGDAPKVRITRSYRRKALDASINPYRTNPYNWYYP